MKSHEMDQKHILSQQNSFGADLHFTNSELMKYLLTHEPGESMNWDMSDKNTHYKILWISENNDDVSTQG